MSEEELLSMLDDLQTTTDNVPDWRSLKELLYAIIMEVEALKAKE